MEQCYIDTVYLFFLNAKMNLENKGNLCRFHELVKSLELLAAEEIQDKKRQKKGWRVSRPTLH